MTQTDAQNEQNNPLMLKQQTNISKLTSNNQLTSKLIGSYLNNELLKPKYNEIKFATWIDYFGIVAINVLQFKMIKFDFGFQSFKLCRNGQTQTGICSGSSINRLMGEKFEINGGGELENLYNALWRPNLILGEYQRIAIQIYQAFDQIIAEGKQYYTLELYKKWLKPVQVYSGVFIYNTLYKTALEIDKNRFGTAEYEVEWFMDKPVCELFCKCFQLAEYLKRVVEE